MYKAILPTPILFIIYSRQELTFTAFDEIRKVRPAKLFLAGDSTGGQKKDEKTINQQVQEVVKGIDWDCSIKIKLQNRKIGHKLFITNAINWLFENEEEGIILEDNCLPGSSFFHYCALLLNLYKNDNSIAHIGGNNFIKDSLRSENYTFSKYPFTCGWATWRRAWKQCNLTFSNFPRTLVSDGLNCYFSSTAEKYTFYNKFFKIYKNRDDTWELYWLYTIWYYKMKAIIPPVNLVKNFSSRSWIFQTNKCRRWTARFHLETVNEIIHPTNKEINKITDDYLFDRLFRRNVISNIYSRIKITLYTLLFIRDGFESGSDQALV